MTTLKDLLSRKAEIEASMAALQQSCAELQQQIEEMLAGRLADLRNLQGKEFGAVNLVFDGFKITETITKKVEWDQDKLADLFGKIMAAGDKPSDFMRMRLDVPEKLFAEFPDQIKAVFADARTVKGSRPTLKFEEVANA